MARFFYAKLTLFVLVLWSAIPTHADILVTRGGNGIERLSDSGTSLGTFIAQAGVAMYYDSMERRLYYANGSFGISRSDPTGTIIETIVSNAGSIVADIELDRVNRKLLWTDQGLGTVQRANLDGSNVETIASGLNFVSNLYIDEANGHLYITAAERIYRSALNGAGALDGST